MSDDTATALEQKKSRRGLLALVGAGGAAAVAALLGRSNGAEAHGDVEGNSSTGNPAVHGTNTSYGFGVQGNADSGIGVYGHSKSYVGVGGDGAQHGVFGQSTSGNGVYGSSNNSNGVHGNSSSGTGVKGTGKVGVRGIGSGASGSMGVHAKNTATKRALRTEGRVQMDCVRTKSLANRSNLITIPSGVNAGDRAVVLATAQSNTGNAAVIERAYRVDSKHIRIVFNKKPARSTKVGYWVVHTP